MRPDADGVFTINKKKYGNHTSIDSLVGHLSTTQRGWPVALDKPSAPQKPSVDVDAMAKAAEEAAVAAKVIGVS